MDEKPILLKSPYQFVHRKSVADRFDKPDKPLLFQQNIESTESHVWQIHQREIAGRYLHIGYTMAPLGVQRDKRVDFVSSHGVVH